MWQILSKIKTDGIEAKLGVNYTAHQVKMFTCKWRKTNNVAKVLTAN